MDGKSSEVWKRIAIKMGILEWYEMALAVAFSVLACYISMFRWRRGLPPGPLPLPFIGCLYLFGKEPQKSLTSLAREYGAIMAFPIGSINAVIVSSAKEAKLLLRTHEMQFINRPQSTVAQHLFLHGEDMGFTAYGDEWRTLRMVMVNNLLSPKSIESLREFREEQVSCMMRKVWSDSQQGTVPVDLSEAIFSTMYDIVWATISRNTPTILAKELLHLPRESVEMVISGLLYDAFPWLKLFEPFLGIKQRMRKTYNAFHSFAEVVLDEHAATEIPDGGNKSFIDRLLDLSKEDSSLTRKQIRSTMLSFHVSSGHTTAVTTEWTLSHLLSRPECLTKAQREVDGIMENEALTSVKESHVAKMSYLKCAVKETMRVNMSPFLPPRVAAEDVRIENYNIPKGTWVIINGWALGMDDMVWKDPQDYVPERFANEGDVDMTAQVDFKNLPFGTGRRGCPGYKLAFQIILLIVGSLLHTFELSVEGEPTDLDMTADKSMMTRVNHLYVLPKLRNKNNEL